MSLLPYLLELEQQQPMLYYGHRHGDRYLAPDNLFSPLARDLNRLNRLSSVLREREMESTIRTPVDKFQVNLDVQHFSPDEISVKIVDGFVVVEGKHEEKKDQHGFVSRQFARRYLLPEGCNVEAIQSQLSSDGVLTIKAPLQQSTSHERVVPIQQTGPVKTQQQTFETKPDVGDGEPQKVNLENGN